MIETYQGQWVRLGQVTSNQAAVTSYDHAYGATWATAFQNPDLWPDSLAIELPQECNGLRGMFAVSDANNETLAVTVWMKDKNGPPKPLVIFSAVTAGTAVVSKDPHTGATLTDFAYADTLTLGTLYIGDVDVYNVTDGVSEWRCDAMGGSWLFLTGDAGTAEDCIGWIKVY